jgi:hypothetical protein
MKEKGILLLYLVPTILIGVIVPSITVYYSIHGLNPLMGTIIVVSALIVAAGLGVVQSGLGFAHASGIVGGNEKDDESLRVLRATVRSIADEEDDINTILREIRDVLKGETK